LKEKAEDLGKIQQSCLAFSAAAPGGSRERTRDAILPIVVSLQQPLPIPIPTAALATSPHPPAPTHARARRQAVHGKGALVASSGIEVPNRTHYFGSLGQ